MKNSLFRFLLFGSYFVIFFIISAAKTRGIGIPNDLETEIIAIINRSKLVLKHTRHWMSHRQRRDSIIITVSKDYRNIIEGLQVKKTSRFGLSLLVMLEINYSMPAFFSSFEFVKLLLVEHCL